MNSPVIFFDDICVLCSRSVQFIYRNDNKKLFYFASMNSESFKKIADNPGIHSSSSESVLLYSNGKVYSRSGAALRIASKLRFPWPLITLLFIIPPFLRNGIYDWIAWNRYKWFGKRISCFLPAGDLKNRFQD
ncbi:thiol-disulfide oxidoreductase DCC family protein [Bacteroidota bacterium]